MADHTRFELVVFSVTGRHVNHYTNDPCLDIFAYLLSLFKRKMQKGTREENGFYSGETQRAFQSDPPGFRGRKNPA
jgi:hypothetical protein